MSNVDLSEGTKELIARLFAPSDRQEAAVLLSEKCGFNLSGTRGWPERGFERIQFAAIKVSGGTLAGLATAVQLANVDWRDLLVAAGFAHDPTAHKSWSP
jgi:hypothetical protein